MKHPEFRTAEFRRLMFSELRNSEFRHSEFRHSEFRGLIEVLDSSEQSSRVFQDSLVWRSENKVTGSLSKFQGITTINSRSPRSPNGNQSTNFCLSNQ